MKDYDEINERSSLIAEIMLLSYLVNSETDFCVFAEFSGHVDSFVVRIMKSKSLYNDEIAATEFYTKYSGDQPWKITSLDILKAKRDHLKYILDNNNIAWHDMEPIRKIITTYQF